MPQRSCPPRVEWRTRARGFEVLIHNPRGLANAIGVRVLASFYKCFMGTERILTFEHLMFLNEKASQQLPDETADEYAFDRNRMVLGLALAGTMYEMGAALQELTATGIARNLRERPCWLRLNELRSEWNREHFAARIRNSLAFHLGEMEHYVTGIEQLETDPVRLIGSNGIRRFSGRYEATWNSLFHGMGLQDNDMKTFVVRTQQAHDELPSLLNEFFREVLESFGVAIEVVHENPSSDDRVPA